MIRDFECKNCGTLFQADENQYVRCHSCGSDHVDYVKEKFSRRKLCFLIALFAAVVSAVTWVSQTKSVSEELVFPDEEEVYASTPVVLKERPVMKVVTMRYDKDAKSYECQVEIQPKQESNIAFTVSTLGEQPFDKNADGVFKNLPFSETDGVYIFRAMDEQADTLICLLEHSGFEMVVEDLVPWTATELEAKINAGESFSDCPYLTPNVKVVLVDKPANCPDYSISTIVSDIVMMFGQQITVEKVILNEFNQISEAHIRLNLPQDFFGA